MRFRFLPLLAIFLMAVCTVIPPAPAMADYPLLRASGTLTATGQYVTIQPLSGQSSCNVEVQSDTGLTLTVQGIVKNEWVVIPVVDPSQTTTSSTITAAGTYVGNCASMIAFQVIATSGSGSAVVNLTASGGVGRVLSSGVNGGRTIVNGSGPITVTNSGNTATVGLTSPLTFAYGGTGATALPSGCIESNGTQLVSDACPTPQPATTPVSVEAGSNVTVATPSPGVFVVSTTTAAPVATATPVTVEAGTNVTVATPSPGVFVVSASASGITAVTGSGNIQVSSGPTPNVTITNSPNFTGAVSAGSFVGGNLTSGKCLQATTGGEVVNAASACLTGISAGANITLTGSSPAPTVAVTESPTFTGFTVIGTAGSYTTGLDGYLNIANGFGGTGMTNFGTSNSTELDGIYSTCLGIYYGGVGEIASLDCSGNIAFAGAVYTPNLYSTSLTAGDCVQATTGGQLVSASGACGSGGGGGVTSITGTSPIVSSGGATPAVSCPTCVVSVSAGTNITVTTGTTPTVAVTAAPSFANITDTSLTSGDCVQAGSGGLLTTISGACGTGGTDVAFALNIGGLASTTSTTSPYSVFGSGPVSLQSGRAFDMTELIVSCLTADSGTLVVTFYDYYYNGTSISSISIGTASVAAGNILGYSAPSGGTYALLTGHSLLAEVTTAGTATYCQASTTGYTLVY